MAELELAKAACRKITKFVDNGREITEALLLQKYLITAEEQQLLRGNRKNALFYKAIGIVADGLEEFLVLEYTEEKCKKLASICQL